MFMVKKIIGALLDPVVLFWVLLLLAWILSQFTAMHKKGRVLLAVVFIGFFLSSFGPAVRLVTEPLEWRYPPVDEWISEHELAAAEIKHIVVLSAGSTVDTRLPAVAQLQDYSLARVVEGMRLYWKFPNAKLIMSGASHISTTSTAELMRNAAIELGVPAEDIKLEIKSKDTKDQAIAIKSMVNNEPFFLVTSATHMARSMALMHGQGLTPIAAPADFITKEAPETSWFAYLPGATALKALDRTVHEYVGLLWATLRNQI